MTLITREVEKHIYKIVMECRQRAKQREEAAMANSQQQVQAQSNSVVATEAVTTPSNRSEGPFAGAAMVVAMPGVRPYTINVDGTIQFVTDEWFR